MFFSASFALGILAFLLIFSLLIIVHELGHFFVARLAGVKVEEFGFGLPPKLWGKKTMRTVEIVGPDGRKKKVRDQMEWTINAIPFGGFVRMLGEDGVPEKEHDPRAFCNRPLLWRMAIAVAGVTMNFLLALFLFTLVATSGFTPLIDPNLSIHPRFQSYFADGHAEKWVERGFYKLKANGAFVLAVDPDSPAAEAGILPGDQIVAVNEKPITQPAEMKSIQQASQVELEYRVARFDPLTDTSQEFAYVLLPETDEDGQKLLGVILSDRFYYQTAEIKYPFSEAPREALSTSRRLVVLSLDTVKTVFNSTLGRIFRLETPQIPEGVGGPVAIWDNTQQLVAIGDMSKIVQFAGVLSLSLAVLNLVPFPALDGGRLFFQLLEGLFFLLLWPVKKMFPQANIPHRFPAKWEGAIHMAGYILLLLFIVAVTWKDISRIFLN